MHRERRHPCSRRRIRDQRDIERVNRINYASVRRNRTEISVDEMTACIRRNIFISGELLESEVARRGSEREREIKEEIIARLGRLVRFLCLYEWYNDKSVVTTFFSSFESPGL